MTPGPDLQRLIYYSESVAKAPADLDGDLRNIIQSSMRKNHDAGVTSFLMVHQGWYLQAIEGPKAAVKTVFERIQVDPRHRAPKVIAARAAEQRCFSGSTMNVRRLTRDDDLLLARVKQTATFEPHRLTARNALALLMTASQSQARRKSVLWLN